MNIVMLCGGSGKRLWPLSNDIRSKQFLKIFKTEDGLYESMIQRMYRQIKQVDAEANVVVATSKRQISSIRNQLGDNVNVSIEPCRRDTFPAIALAAEYLYDIEKIGLDEVVIVCPVDPYVDVEYFVTLKEMEKQAVKGEANLLLMGIEPTYPSEKYGYIIPCDSNLVSIVNTFKEKPTENIAKKYIEKGALWNGGVFAFKLQYIIEKSHELIDYVDYHDLYSKYETLPKISFDYSVVEKEKSIQVYRFSGKWMDLGTWNTMTDIMEEAIIGTGVIDDKCENVHIVNELDLPIVAMGLSNVIISASPDGILVSDKDRSADIKKYVEHLDNSVRYAEKSWGDFKVIDAENNSLVVKVDIKAGDKMNYHSHQFRDEVWIVVSGKGRTVVDGMEQKISVGDVVTMKAGCRHTIFADSDLIVIEVQIGKDISVNDKRKFELEN